MANWNRKSRVSQNRNRKQSQKRSNRRGGAPPVAPPPPALPEFMKGKKMTGNEATGHSVCPPLPENDCVKVKPCQWIKGSATRSGYCRRRSERDSTMSESSGQFKSMTADIDERRRLALKAMYESEDESEASQSSDDSPMPSVQSRAVPARAVPARAAAAVAVARGSVSKKARSPAQLRRASAKASGQVYVPVKSTNVPMGCVQRDYNITTKAGNSYSTSRCVDSKDPNVNDEVNCMVNPETNKCKKVARA